MLDKSPAGCSNFAPTSEIEISEIIRDSASIGRQLWLAGNGTRLDRKDEIEGVAVVSSRHLTGVVDYEPGALTLVARTGTPVDEIVSMLERERQVLAFEPIDHRHALGTTGIPTIGGVVGANVSGPRRLAAGACRDHLLGMRFVDGRGRIVKNGGRVMKNVTGLDLSKLLCGSFGTLGLVTEVALKTAPMPEREETLAINNITVAQAIAIFGTALATPFEISGAAYRAKTVYLRIQGFSKQIEYRRERLRGLFDEYAIEVHEDDSSKFVWLGLRDLHHFASTGLPIWEIVIKPTDAPAVVSGLEDLGGSTSLDWGGGRVWYSGVASPTDIQRICATGQARAVRIEGARTKGFFPPETDFIKRASRTLREIFDPAGIFNSALLDR